ncbi:KPN_02809 family neutral zinc metallopeptidase [Brumimicrobium mesophilum]|uniref:KPN_02809 family neutral zinc metallopeptidase n=1 Tax=Brumimicrobium mesophilum TaxID=392717 RepID=UPI000D13F243|nr:neutral zinc metallopeptidase [Brumimicrobium mesophilum]
MKWKGRRKSSNVDDRRGISSKSKILGGGGLIGIIILLVSVFGGETGKQIAPILEQFNQSSSSGMVNSEQRELSAEEVEIGDFVATVFQDTEDVWNKIFQENNMVYEEPGMVLFTGQVSTACGNATSASGPFYCPGDKKVYMDLDFFQELETRYGAKGGDFAMAYVIAHEVGHHVQTILGITAKVRQIQSKKSQVEANKMTVKQELQADFYAGVWAYHMKQYLEEGDIDEALSAAHAVGDDAIQKRVRGNVTPDSFTHGTSAQRKKWFTKGFKTGDIRQGDTYSSDDL